jgi:hypothetical protein
MNLQTLPTLFISHAENKNQTIYNYRFWRKDHLLTLLRWAAGLVTVRRANARICYLLSTLRIRQVHQGAYLH